MRIRGVLFDFDDTLTKSGGLDYLQIRSDIGCPQDASILSYLDGIADQRERDEARRILETHELRAAANAQPAEGAEELVAWLRNSKFHRGIITRNTRRAVDISLKNFAFVGSGDFDIILTRDDDIPVKPEPDGVLHTAEIMGILPAELLVVGDYIYDIEAGNAAGSITVFFDSRPKRTFEPPDSTYTITHISEVQKLVVSHS